MSQSKNIGTATENFNEAHLRGLARYRVMIFCILSILASLICIVLMPWDWPISELGRQLDLPGDLRKAVDLSEAFAHGSGCTVILLAVLLADLRRWRIVMLAVLITSASGLSANAAKAAFVRTRPNAVKSVSHSATNQGIASIEFLGKGSFWEASYRSFPSGHSATAWGLAIGLSLLYPRATVVYVALALAASFQRLSSGAHYPSDILAGAAIAFLIASGVLSSAWSLKTLQMDSLQRLRS